jgi:hypothetical protein
MPQVDKNADNEMVALTVEYPGDRRFASDGLEPPNKARLYLIARPGCTSSVMRTMPFRGETRTTARSACISSPPSEAAHPPAGRTDTFTSWQTNCTGSHSFMNGRIYGKSLRLLPHPVDA